MGLISLIGTTSLMGRIRWIGATSLKGRIPGERFHLGFVWGGKNFSTSYIF